jgi:hypothetical protein
MLTVVPLKRAALTALDLTLRAWWVLARAVVP